MKRLEIHGDVIRVPSELSKIVARKEVSFTSRLRGSKRRLFLVGEERSVGLVVTVTKTYSEERMYWYWLEILGTTTKRYVRGVLIAD